jgi:hypothetical protein
VSYEQEREIREQIEALDRQRKELVHRLGEVKAGDRWSDEHSDRIQALSIADSHGLDKVDFCRRRGLSESEAMDLIRAIPPDWR